jgi:hypothetical protein
MDVTLLHYIGAFEVFKSADGHFRVIRNRKVEVKVKTKNHSLITHFSLLVLYFGCVRENTYVKCPISFAFSEIWVLAAE